MADDNPFDELPSIEKADPELPGSLELGAFSTSLAVADLAASQTFYEKLGFVTTGGSADDNWLILKNGETTIGLFHGMFEGNILTFNPGLTNRMETIESFTDIREIGSQLTAKGVTLDQPIAEDAGDAGPASIMLTDPDGNVIMVDQFF